MDDAIRLLHNWSGFLPLPSTYPSIGNSFVVLWLVERVVARCHHAGFSDTEPFTQTTNGLLSTGYTTLLRLFFLYTYKHLVLLFHSNRVDFQKAFWWKGKNNYLCPVSSSLLFTRQNVRFKWQDRYVYTDTHIHYERWESPVVFCLCSKPITLFI